jgi:hypothetical protein
MERTVATPTNTTADQQQKSDEAKERDTFQGQFDRLLIILIAFGLVVSIFYGGSAGTCPPDPQQLPAAADSAVATEAGPTAPKAKAGTIPKVDAAATGNSSLTGARSETGRRAGVTRPRCESPGNWFAGILLALVIALAALALGAFVGFLFGLPRTLTSSEVRAARLAAATANPQGGNSPSNQAVAVTGGPGSEVNTNLEKISDWLTTIIVGVGLTKLEEIPRGLESFGENVALYFGYGGKIFGIGGGLFFLIAGFFLSYVGTRVKLSLIFVWSELTNRGAASILEPRLIGPLGAVAGQSTESKAADQEVLNRSLAELRTPEDLAAYGGAAAREGKKELAADVLHDAVKEKPTDPAILGDYAGVLALNGKDEEADQVLQTLRTIRPEALPEAQDKVDIGRMRAGLYDGRYERSVAIGEQLLNRPVAAREPWIHIWLACAYGQKHAALKQQTPPAGTSDIDSARNKVVQEVDRALTLDPTLKSYLRTLYDPAQTKNGDNDLTSLYPDPAIDKLLAEPATQQPAEEPLAEVAPKNEIPAEEAIAEEAPAEEAPAEDATGVEDETPAAGSETAGKQRGPDEPAGS